MKPAVFLDRDGTIIEEVGYLDRLDRVAFFPWTIDAVRALNRAGLIVVIVTNQSGIARGFFSQRFVDDTHRHMTERLAAGGAHIDAYYYCPHHPAGTIAAFARLCDCRKPERGLMDHAVQDLAIDPTRSFMVGDKWSDVVLGRTVGARSLLVRTGTGAAQEAHPQDGVTADAIVDNLAAAASWILLNPQPAIRDPQCS